MVNEFQITNVKCQMNVKCQIAKLLKVKSQKVKIDL